MEARHRSWTSELVYENMAHGLIDGYPFIYDIMDEDRRYLRCVDLVSKL